MNTMERMRSGEVMGEGEVKELASLSRGQQHSGAPVGVDKVLRRFNRNTGWVAMVLLVSVIFATLTVAFKEHASNADKPSVELRQTLSKPLLNINPALPLNVIGSDGQSLGETTSEPGTSVEQEFNPKTSYPDVQANPDSSFQGNRPDPVRLIRPNNPRVSYRSLVRHRIVDVKTRLIALWHQSLVPREKLRGWTLFSYLKKEEKRKAVAHPK